MDRAEAYKILRLDEAAAGDMVQAAYWTLVRQAQDRSRDDVSALRDIDSCNKAYTTLAPGAQIYTPRPRVQATPQGTETEIIDRVVDWLSEETLRTRARWVQRNPEIGVMLGATLFLMVIALAAGASFWLVTASVLAILAAIWSPWRRVTAIDFEPTESAEPATLPGPATGPRPSSRDGA
jgi:hypothetical protein